MNIEKEIFKRYDVNFDKLIDYGFIKDCNNYKYTINFLNNDFQAIIIIDQEKNVLGKVIDLNTNLEYSNIRLEKYGAFISLVIENYKKILINIRDKCFNKKYFVSKQANRIGEYIINEYNDYPEFLWDKLPTCGVFRNKKNNKWYAIVMNIKGKIINKDVEEIEIINLKLPDDEIENLLKVDGYYKAYHMNKKSWISIVLDDTINDIEIYNLIDESYSLINSK